MKLTPGKLAGLKAVSNERGVIAAAAMDQRGSLKKALGPTAGDKELIEFKVAVSEVLTQHRSVVVGDSSRGRGKIYGVLGGQETLAVPSMRAKILAQRDGLGVGWVPLERVRGLLKRGELVALQTEHPREPNNLYVAWRSDVEGRALQWWVSKLSDRRLARRLVAGLGV